ncbi:MAG: FAD-dependent oxidoreductase [Phycisphaerales bacterium]|nr:FAD-dependent oxidoreductase [Phycisphaerales bacterium]
MVIIGAGPAGLGAGYRLRELGHENFQLYERHPYVGGLSHSFTDEAGFTWDIGGHVMFSHYTYYDQCFDRLMGDAFTLNDRECWVRMLNRWVPYPFQNNIRYLPREIAFECLAGLIKAQTGRGTVRSAADAANFGEFIDAVFGEGIAKHFMRPYNFKVWAHPPEMMNKTWIGERVAIIDIERALKNVVLEQDDFGWGPNNRFKFPLKGGTGAFYQRFGDVLHDRITLETTVKSIDVDRKVVTFTDGRTDRYDALLSTMPLDVLCRDILTGQVPRAIRDTAARLRHSSGFIVGIGIKRPCPSTKSWMYFPGPECPFYRVTYLSNYSPYMTPDKDTHYSFLCEVSQSEFKPVDPDAVVEDVIRGLENTGLMAPGERADIISRWCYHADYSYPTPTVDRDEILSEVIPWLEEQGIYSRGRFGMWKYEVSNTDHSLMQGVELVNRLLLGEKEHTIGLVYKITDDGRAAAEHERAAVAGSGERKLAPAAVEPKPEPGVPSLGAERVEHAGDIDEAELAEEELGITSRNEAKH